MKQTNKPSIDEGSIDETLNEFKDSYPQYDIEIVSFDKSKSGEITILYFNLMRGTKKEALELKKLIGEEITAGCKKLIIDFGECEFIDTTFLGTLVVTLKTMNSNGGELRLIEPRLSNKNLLIVTNTLKLFNFYKTQDEAIKDF